MAYRVWGKFGKLAKKAGLDEKAIEALKARGYFDAPASKGHHLAYPSGLLEHSVNVTEQLVKLTKTLKIKWQRPEGPYLVGLLHDLVKCDCYKIVRDGNKFSIKWCDTWGDLHGLASTRIVNELDIGTEEDEWASIRYHMGRFGVGKDYLECEYRAALKNYGPQVLATHFADWWSSENIEEEK